ILSFIPCFSCYRTFFFPTLQIINLFIPGNNCHNNPILFKGNDAVTSGIKEIDEDKKNKTVGFR
ncbi:MAG: hypothetical protein OEL68_06350, partial [Desulfobulbaceae bacterium]|nr:hypothetical protein [Desulfobulbaceae bacterium]